MVRLFCDLSRLGTLILFGSILSRAGNGCNDVDVALVVPDGSLKPAKKRVGSLVEKMSLGDHVLIQELFEYDKNPSEAQTNHFLHVLICEQKDLESEHPIVVSLSKGVPVEFRNVA